VRVMGLSQMFEQRTGFVGESRAYLYLFSWDSINFRCKLLQELGDYVKGTRQSKLMRLSPKLTWSYSCAQLLATDGGGCPFGSWAGKRAALVQCRTDVPRPLGHVVRLVGKACGLLISIRICMA
jgi:hypothetical protein